MSNRPVIAVDPYGLWSPLDLIEWVFNATADPVYAPSNKGCDNLSDLVRRTEADWTGGALPYMEGVSLIPVGPGIIGDIRIVREIDAGRGVPRVIGTVLKGFTGHGIERVIERGVRPYEILDALRNPVRVLPGREGVVRYIGKWVELRINDAGDLVTAIRFKPPTAP